MILPHCTWDKFGDILANSGARTVGLFDELVSFFSTMNMYSATKLQVSDTKEYQDFLQMYTGKAKTRETVTGNANFKMNQTSFTLVGFTQPQAALPIIEDLQNNAKGFTSRLLWWFPTPVFCKMRDTMLQDTEKEEVRTFTEQLVHFLANLYAEGESTYTIEDDDKITSVDVTRKQFQLDQEALDCFETIHDDWELNICQKYPHDALVGGLYSRGKSHILRLAVPIQLLLDFCQGMENHSEEDSTPMVIQPSSSGHEVGEDEQSDDDDGDDQLPGAEIEQEPLVTAQAVNVACSIVKSCLAQICALNGKSFINSAQECTENDEMDSTTDSPAIPPVGAFKKLLGSVILKKGKVVSLSILLTKGVFRRNTGDCSGKDLMLKVLEDLSTLDLGNVEIFTIPGNKTQVYFFVKSPVPGTHEQVIGFIQRLASVGVSLGKYNTAYDAEDADSEKHLKDYNSKKAMHCSSASKRPRQD